MAAPLFSFTAVSSTLVFLALAGLHIYWAAGGTWGLRGALPAHANGAVVFRPGAGMVGTVALLLLALAALSAAHLLPHGPGLLPRVLQAADWTVAAGLALRGLGDFKFVGLSKRVRNTTFARLDTRYYTPLCLLLAAGFAGLAYTAAP